MSIEVMIAIVPVLIAVIISVTLIAIVKMCLKAKVHSCSFVVSKTKIKAEILRDTNTH